MQSFRKSFSKRRIKFSSTLKHDNNDGTNTYVREESNLAVLSNPRQRMKSLKGVREESNLAVLSNRFLWLNGLRG